MTLKRKERIHALLKGIETGNEAAVAVVNPDKYIQHNPQTREGGEGLAALFKRLAKSSPRVNIVRLFSDGDYVFGHTQYDFGTSRVGFEVFRFEGECTVEHWDNIQLKKDPNTLGYSMLDGPTEATELDKTESNRDIIKSFVHDVLIQGHVDLSEQYINKELYTEHDPDFGETRLMQYQKNHRLFAEGNFLLSVSEGSLNGVHSSFYDLYRVAKNMIVEHWNTIESVAPRSEWKNDNGKF